MRAAPGRSPVSARGTPRIATRLLRRIRDFAEVAGTADVSREIVQSSLERLEVDEAGLDKVDRILLTTLIEKFQGRPGGSGHPGGVRPGGVRDDRGRLRALPAADGLPAAHSQGAGGDDLGLCPPEDRLPGPSGATIQQATLFPEGEAE